MARYLFVKGAGGIGNRFFSLTNAIDYAIKTKRIVYVDWSDGLLGPRNCNMFNRYFWLDGLPVINSVSEIADMSDLSFFPGEWKKYPEAGIYDKYTLYPDSGNSRNIPIKIINRLGIFLTDNYKLQKNQYWKPRKKQKWAPKGIFPLGRFLARGLSSDIVVYCDFNPPFNSETFLKFIKLKEFFFERVLEIRDNIFPDCRVVGLHIRNTDKSPDKNIEILKEIIAEKMSYMTFFLSSDNISVINDFQKLENVIVYPKNMPVPLTGGIHHGHYEFEYDYPEQMFEDSLTDLYLLSFCDILWYQGNSTFSIIARTLHGKPEYQWDWNSQSVNDIRI